MFRHSKWIGGAVLIAILAVSLGMAISVAAEEKAFVIPPPTTDAPKAAGPLQKAVFAGGCFWGVQGVFEHVRGVRQVLSGYSGGDKAGANYEMVSSGRTNHAEAVEITYDPKEVSYGQLLHVFFSVAHDPTQLNRQGPDTGPQYRSHIFFANESQKNVAQAYIAQLDKTKIYGRPIVTRLDALQAFYPAEDYHQDFMVKNPQHPYIVINDIPKVQNLKKVFAAIYQAQPVLVKGK
jgi:peptide-methionine (S)-S-oxide reductase